MAPAPMMDFELSISSLISHAARFHGQTRITSIDSAGNTVTTNWSTVERNAKRIAAWLGEQGFENGTRVTTLAWNTHRHLELYFGVPGAGHVCHTANPRLHEDDLSFIVNEAEARVVFFDIDLLGKVLSLKDRLLPTTLFVALCPHDPDIQQALGSNVVFYDEMLRKPVDDYAWPEFDERTPAMLCYTSGTTGNPKGVLFTHRSIVLHTLGCNQPDGMGLAAADCLLMVVPMFHVNAWGTPHMAAVVGAELALPGPHLDGESLIALINATRATHALGVPTIWLNLLDALQRTGQRIDSLKRSIVGGAALPPSLMNAFKQDHDVDLIHGWGMTEMSPVGAVNQPLAHHRDLSPEDMASTKCKQGRPPFGIDMRIVDEHGTVLPHDGEATGNLQVRGPWVVHHYYRQEQSALTDDGWFDTGDISSIDREGYMRIHDRAKDTIKSGGEWISSVELENIAMSHPGIANVAAIAAQDAKWGERPILIAVRKDDVSETDLIACYHGKIAKWQIPDKVIFVEALPIGNTGKILKTELRKRYGSALLD